MGLYDTLKALVDFKDTYRRIVIGNRRESDAEHSWQIAMMALAIAPKDVDLEKAVKMALVHDLPEIITGDVSVADSAGRVGKKQRESSAAETLAQQPGLEYFHALWKEYEAGTTQEAKFIQALDKVEPLIHNVKHNGSTWKDGGHTYQTVLGWKLPYWNLHPDVTPLFEQAFAEALERKLFAEPAISEVQ